MKRSRLSYDEWKCIVSKDILGKTVNSELLNGYLGLLEIKEVSKAQIWKFNGEDITVCDKGRKWLSILPCNDWYCITAMMDEDGKILLWYIDMIAAQGVDADGMPYFDDLYLDLIVYPDGTIIVDDMDELQDALAKGDITKEQFNLALETSKRLQQGLLSNVSSLIEYTRKCHEIVKGCQSYGKSY